MQKDIVGQVLGVTGKPTKNGGTIFKVKFSDGEEYGTFDGELAQKAASLAGPGQQVSARVESVQKGQWMNHNLLDVAPQGQLAPGAVPLAGTIITPSIGAGSNVQPEAPVLAGAGITMLPAGDAQKDAQIAKSVAVKVAAEIVSGLFSGAGPEVMDEALECFDKAGKHVLEILTGAGKTEQDAPVEQTPEAVATAVNAAAGTEVVAVGATPEW